MKYRYALTGVILAAVLSAGVFLLKKNTEKYPRPSFTAAQGKTTGEKIRGSLAAPVQITEFSDFQCPACQKAEPVLKAIFESYPGKVRLVFRHFPLGGHQWAAMAHQAAECANRAGYFWEFHDRLYREQASWSASNPLETFVRYARDLGIDLNAFAACMADERVTRQIQAERAEGEVLQVKSTPTFFINGERFVGAVDLEIKGKEKLASLLGVPAGQAPAGISQETVDPDRIPIPEEAEKQ